MTNILTNGRVELIPATIPLIELELHEGETPFAALDVAEPPYWPPELNDNDSFNYALSVLRGNPGTDHWGFYYLVETLPRRHLVGMGGFKGPADDKGDVEIGYSILEPYRRCGYAAAMCNLLIAKAFADSAVQSVSATTLPHLLPSIGVLKKCGFSFVGEVEGIVTYRLARP